MSRVFLAEERELGRKVVIKLLAPDLAEGLSADRFAREIRLAATLQQANIVTLLRAGTSPLPYYTMPFVEGQSLRARLDQTGKLPEPEVVSILRDVARALTYAHAHGVIHRDIKPDNVLLSGGTAVVTDFGIAKAIEVAKTSDTPGVTGEALTGTGISIGTPAYMAPEQVASDRGADQRTDIYSFGCLAYELLSGQTPFHGRTPQGMIAAHVVEAPPTLKGVAAALSSLVMRCLAKDPAQRPQSAAELLASLESLGASAASARPAMSFRNVGIATIVIVAFALLLRSYLTSKGDAPITLGTTTQVTSAPELEVDVSISPDGRFVAYGALLDGVLRVMMKPTAAQEGERATAIAASVPGTQRWPRWSPDGQKIVFASDTRVYEVPALGGAARLLFDAGLDLIRPNPTPVYSPDGKSILFNTAEGIKIVGIAGGSPRMVVAGPELHSAEWSPDGTRIAYVAGNRQGVNATGTLAPSAVFVTRVDHVAPVRISDVTHANIGPAWLSNDALLFISSAGGTRDIYRARIEPKGQVRGAPVRLTTGLEPFSISYSARTHRLAYSVLRSRFNIWGGPLRASGETPIGDLREITTGNQRVEGIALSPDGKTLAFDSNRYGNADIFTMPATGGEPTQITRDSTDEFQPEFSRDGRHLAFYSLKNGTRDVYMMDADGRNVEAVTNLPTEERAAAPSSDGTQVIYLSGGQGTTAQNVFISRRELSGRWSPGRQLTTKGALFPRWSPDDKHISYSRAGETMVLSPIDGSERVVAKRGVDGSIGFFAQWAPDASALFVARINLDAGEWTYWRVPLDGGAERLLLRTGTRKGRSANATFATNGQMIYVTLGGDEGDVWTVDLKTP